MRPVPADGSGNRPPRSISENWRPVSVPTRAVSAAITTTPSSVITLSVTVTTSVAPFLRSNCAINSQSAFGRTLR